MQLRLLRQSGTDIAELGNEDNDNWVENWLAAESSRINLHYWRGEAQLQAAVLERARSLVETRAGPWQKADFYVHLTGPRCRSNRFAVDKPGLANVKAARALVADVGPNEAEFHWHTLRFPPCGARGLSNTG